jgi:predicted nucleic acid-binding protein
MRIYLDTCCYNRPFDDQTQIIIELETSAKIRIQKDIRNGIYELVWSYILEYENNNNPYEEKRQAIAIWKNIAKHYCASSEDIYKNNILIESFGIMPMDAMHISCAMKSECSYFITTDKKLLNKKINNINIISPIDFIIKMGG